MLVKELREILEEYDGEMEIVAIDNDRNFYDIEEVQFNYSEKEPMLALKYN